MIHTIRKGIIKFCRRIFERRARSRILSNKGLWSVLNAYIAQTKSTGCQFTDYESLYNYIRQTKPREILECGTGTSTVVLAYALKENEMEDGIVGSIISMEEKQNWFDLANSIMPDELRKYVDIRLSPTVEDGYAIYRGIRYRDVPNRPYDFVFTDGPSTLAPSDGTRTFDFDYLHLVRRSKIPIFGIIDGRLTTCYILQKVFGPGKVRFDVFRNLGFVGPCTKDDLRGISGSSSIALAHSKRIFAATQFHMIMEKRISGKME